MPKRRKLTKAEKDRLDSSKIPDVTRRQFDKALEDMDVEAADRLYALYLDQTEVGKKRKKGR